MPDNTPPKQLEPYMWKPGQSANPLGRPKGSRNKLSETFLADVLTEWENHGAVAISDMREKNPADFCKMVASLVPKEFKLDLNNDIEMSDDELRGRIRSLAASLAPLIGGVGGAGDGVEASASPDQPSIVH